MRKIILSIISLLIFTNSHAQTTYYFPPKIINATWDTISPTSLGWCTNYIDSVYDYLDLTHDKAFIILKDGKIALEHYTGTFTKDSIWYWASAGKTLTGFLTGIAQEEGFLSINDTTAKYLGNGWTSCNPIQEANIKVRNQLTMTTGLDDNVPNVDCTYDTCLIYKADAGTRWAYHNAPYYLLQNVVQSATGVPFSQYTNTKLKTPTGMIGSWVDSTYYSRARDMARFGSLILNHGIWNQDTVMHDTSYFHQMTNTSQNLNLSYGYLWWLNGKGSYMIPQSQIVIPTNLIPNAPSDLIAALGKNDQKLYVIPSMNMVIVRMGDAAYSAGPTLTVFDNNLWGKLNQLFCNSTGTVTFNEPKLKMYPNPTSNYLHIESDIQITSIEIFDINGKTVLSGSTSNADIDISKLAPGCYFIRSFQNNNLQNKLLRFVKLPQ